MLGSVVSTSNFPIISGFCCVLKNIQQEYHDNVLLTKLGLIHWNINEAYMIFSYIHWIVIQEEIMYKDFFMEKSFWYRIGILINHKCRCCPVSIFIWCRACHYLSLLCHNYANSISNICLDGCLKSCEVSWNAFWYW